VRLFRVLTPAANVTTQNQQKPLRSNQTLAERVLVRLYSNLRRSFVALLEKQRPLREFFGGFSIPTHWPATETRAHANYHRYLWNYVTVCLLICTWMLLRSPRLLLSLTLLGLTWLFVVSPQGTSIGGASPSSSTSAKQTGLLVLAVLFVYWAGAVSAIIQAGIWTFLVCVLHMVLRREGVRDVRKPSGQNISGWSGGGRGGESGAESDGGSSGWGNQAQTQQWVGQDDPIYRQQLFQQQQLQAQQIRSRGGFAPPQTSAPTAQTFHHHPVPQPQNNQHVNLPRPKDS